MSEALITNIDIKHLDTLIRIKGTTREKVSTDIHRGRDFISHRIRKGIGFKKKELEWIAEVLDCDVKDLLMEQVETKENRSEFCEKSEQELLELMEKILEELKRRHGNGWNLQG